MYRSTFDIISKYVARKNPCTIVFDTDGGAAADMEKKVVHLPKNITDQNVFGAIAMLMHESAHIAYSGPAYKVLDKDDEVQMNIFNCIEDVRIDRKNFQTLPNIVEFYRKMMEDHCNHSKNKNPTIPFTTKVMVNAIMYMENFHYFGFPDKDVERFLTDTQLIPYMEKAAKAIDLEDWPNMLDYIEKIRKLLAKEGKNRKEDVGQAMNKISGLVHPTLPDEGKKLEGNHSEEVLLDEQTVNQFKELLNITEKQEVKDGLSLNTDKLTAFFTEDIEDLFKNEVVIQKKKSKIIFLLDASGSMGEPLLDGQDRCSVVAKCTLRIIRILKEVQMMEGLNISWETWMFQSKAKRIDESLKEYGTVGGTNLDLAFRDVLAYLAKDHSVEGNKIVIVLTDGEVSSQQIDCIKQSIIHYGGDVKTLLIGVGCDPASLFVTEILGNNIILAEENANLVILEAIRRLLE